ncbi:chitin synthase-domain-containing protein [Phlyctochytrium arcticum]|nr:chitin synthase-domain-containing protein [Phlyctochytrium arcticum]
MPQESLPSSLAPIALTPNYSTSPSLSYRKSPTRQDPNPTHGGQEQHNPAQPSFQTIQRKHPNKRRDSDASTVVAMDHDGSTLVHDDSAKSQPAPSPSPDSKEESPSRSAWASAASILTFPIPNALLSASGLRTSSRRQAWREKSLLMMIVLVASVLFVGLVHFVGSMCSSDPINLTPEQLSKSSNIAIHGRIVDLKSLPATSNDPTLQELRKQALDKKGQDISKQFPTLTLLTRDQANAARLADPDLAAVVPDVAIVDRFLQTITSGDFGYVLNQTSKELLGCPAPPNESGIVVTAPCFEALTGRAYSIVDRNAVGYVVYSEDQLATRYNSLIGAEPALVVIDDFVYDVKEYLKVATRNGAGIQDQVAFLSREITSALMDNLGKDASAAMEKVSGGKRAVIAAMNKLFFAGILSDAAIAPKAVRYNPLFLAIGMVVYVTMLAKIFMTFSRAILMGPARLATPETPHTILFVPVYNEDPVTLQRALESLAHSDYDARKKLLFVVVDGVAVQPGALRDCGTAIAGILGHSVGAMNTQSYIYESVGFGERRGNSAKVFSGVYQATGGKAGSDSDIPYVVVIKTGAGPQEITLPGNRGKRDSMLILLDYLAQVHYNQGSEFMNPLQLELHARITKNLQMDPIKLEYLIVMDADSYVEPDAVQRLVARMHTRPRIVAVHGALRPLAKRTTFATLVQAYPWYHTHHLAPALDSLLGGNGRSWSGGFAAYRILLSDGTPCLCSSEVIEEFAKDTTGMSSENAVLLGEDRRLAHVLISELPRLMKASLGSAVSPKIEYCSAAVAHSDMPTCTRALFGQQRRSFNARFHILVSAPFSFWSNPIRKLLTYSELLAMILAPAATIYMYFVLGRIALLMIRNCPNLSFTHTDVLVNISLAVLFLVQIVFYLLRLDIKGALTLPFYIVLGIPIFQVVIPIYGFLSMDRIIWGDTVRLGNSASRGHGADPTRGGASLVSATSVIERLATYTGPKWTGRFAEKSEMQSTPHATNDELRAPARAASDRQSKYSDLLHRVKSLTPSFRPNFLYRGQTPQFEPYSLEDDGRLRNNAAADSDMYSEANMPLSAYVYQKHLYSMAGSSRSSMMWTPLDHNGTRYKERKSMMSAVTILGENLPDRHRLNSSADYNSEAGLPSARSTGSYLNLPPDFLNGTGEIKRLSTLTMNNTRQNKYPVSNRTVSTISHTNNNSSYMTTSPQYAQGTSPGLNPRVVSGVTSHYPSFATVLSSSSPYHNSFNGGGLTSAVSSTGTPEPLTYPASTLQRRDGIKREVVRFLDTVDVNLVTLRDVLKAIEATLGPSTVDGSEKFVRDCVEEYTLRNLALI